MQTLRPLYKKNTKGKTLLWFLEVEGEKYRTVSGQKDGTLKRSAWTIAKPKNVGKINATTPEEQAQLEAEAKYTKKLAQGGYKESEDDLDTVTFFEPMLAKAFVKDATKVAKAVDNCPNSLTFREGKVWVQPKLDGIRCIAKADGLWTRQGKKIVACPHIERALEPYFIVNPKLILDGELYNHELKDDFNEITSIVRKQKPTEANILEAEELIQYYIYDFGGTDTPYSERYKWLVDYMVSESPIQILEARNAFSRVELDIYMEQCLDKGYEGIMVRLGNAKYEQKRSKNLLKYKKFIEDEFKVVQILEGDGNNAGMAARVLLELHDGKLCMANMTGSWEYCIEVLIDKNKYIGGEATVSFFNYTPDGMLRFPRVKQLYEGKRDV